jgi:hypothetical protein
MAWWYASIGLGFVLLGAYRMLAGEAAWLIVLRFVIAAGFLALAAFEFRGR